ncbi:MAG: hypothetical protein ACO4BJ_07350, partial [Planctomycetota bacterium]
MRKGSGIQGLPLLVSLHLGESFLRAGEGDLRRLFGPVENPRLPTRLLRAELHSGDERRAVAR